MSGLLNASKHERHRAYGGHVRTLIQGGWVVGWADGQHQVIRDGVCVVEDDHILHVGKEYAGSVDATVDAAGKLVSPGFISTHLHAGHNASDYVFLDVGRPEGMARNYMNWQAGGPGQPPPPGDNPPQGLFGPRPRPAWRGGTPAQGG